MERLPVGAITFLLVPYPDGTGGKRRPAVDLNKVNDTEYWLVEITSQPTPFPNGVFLEESDFEFGALRVRSQVRCDRILTAHEELLRNPAEAMLKLEVHRKIVSTVIALLPS